MQLQAVISKHISGRNRNEETSHRQFGKACLDFKSRLTWQNVKTSMSPSCMRAGHFERLSGYYRIVMNVHWTCMHGKIHLMSHFEAEIEAESTLEAPRPWWWHRARTSGPRKATLFRPFLKAKCIPLTENALHDDRLCIENMKYLLGLGLLARLLLGVIVNNAEIILIVRGPLGNGQWRYKRQGKVLQFFLVSCFACPK